MSKATQTLDLVALCKAVGESIGKAKKLDDQSLSIKEGANVNVIALNKAKAKVGTYKKDGTGCALATAFVDGGVAEGLSHSTMQKTYLPTFKAHVASGKPIKDWNLQRAKPQAAKATAQGTGKTLAQKLATVYRDTEFKKFCEDLETSFQDDEGTIFECIESYLILSGALKEDEGK